MARYFPGMMTSVFTSSPNFQARPLVIFLGGGLRPPSLLHATGERRRASSAGPRATWGGAGRGEARARSAWSDALLPPALRLSCSPDLFGGGDGALDRGGGRHGGVRQVGLGGRVAHPADEISVGRRETHFTRPQDSHVTAEAGPAGRRRDGGAGLGEYLEQALLQRLVPDPRAGGNHDETRPGVSLLAAEDPRGDPQVFQLGVRAGADEDLVQRRSRHLIHGDYVVGRERLGHLGAHPGDVEVVFRDVTGVRGGLIDGPGARSAVPHVA